MTSKVSLKFKSIFKVILVIDGWSYSQMDVTSPYLTSTLDQVMAWCHRAASLYLGQCWPRSMSSHDVTWPQWVKAKPYEFFRFRQTNRWHDPVLRLPTWSGRFHLSGWDRRLQGTGHIDTRPYGILSGWTRKDLRATFNRKQGWWNLADVGGWSSHLCLRVSLNGDSRSFRKSSWVLTHWGLDLDDISQQAFSNAFSVFHGSLSSTRKGFKYQYHLID